MPRLYISGPVTGVPDDNRPAFEEARLALTEAGHWASIPHRYVPWGTPHPEAMQLSISVLTKCYVKPNTPDVEVVREFDGVALLPGWEQSEGARLEKQVAEACGIPVQDGGRVAVMTIQHITYYKCDRCGKRYRRSNEVGRLTWDVPGWKTEADLCAECSKEFNDFMHGCGREAPDWRI